MNLHETSDPDAAWIDPYDAAKDGTGDDLVDDG